jgi:OmpA-OmpF porin, OOP family
MHLSLDTDVMLMSAPMRTRCLGRLGLAVVIAGAVTATTRAADAQEAKRGFAVNRFEPAERGSHWFASESLDYRGKVRPAIGIVGDYSYRSFVVFQPDGDIRASVVRNAFYLHPGASLALYDRVRVSFSLPIQAGVDGHTATVTRDGVVTNLIPPPKDGGLGDLRFGADARILGEAESPFTLAAGLQAFAPSGSTSQYAGDGEWRLKPRVMASGDIPIVGNSLVYTYAGQVAVNYRVRDEVVGVGSIGSEFNLTASTGVKLLDRNLVVGPEFWGSTVFGDPFGKKTTPMELALGAHWLIADQVRVGAGVGTGLTRSFGAPVSRVLLGVEWAPGVSSDRDGDGIDDKDDACPDTRGVRSADPARNGCPPPAPVAAAPADRDNDGIEDSADACPDIPGVKTGDPATNGCKDSDGDGVYDPRDACPAEKGAASQDLSINGCPDTDGDGVVDKVDACPTEPGKPDPDPKKNGCPVDPDRDKDGIANEQDACPDEPGKPNPDPKKNGCPTAFIAQGQIKILDQVKFKLGSAALEQGKDSMDVLEAVLKVLNEHPEVKKVRIEGHTDKTGSAAINKKLSADRAASVVKWLTGKGIAKDRLSSTGLGPDQPIDTNDTEQGRKNNRRVEFHIEDGTPRLTQ